MANIQLKTLKFPGLDDTYVLPEVSINDPNNDGNVELLFRIPPTLITFSITSSYDGLGLGTYQAEEGMTWGEWVDSSYNTVGFYIDTNEIHPPESGYAVLSLEGYGLASSSDVLVANATYAIGY